MSEEEFEEQNLDEFLKNAAEILIKNEEESKNTMIESLYEHLKTVLKDKTESENFFTLLNNIIFVANDSESKKTFNKQPFILYPIIYSYNKKESLDYIKYFLASLQQSITEENKPHFSFLISVFSNFINCFFNNDDKKTNTDKDTPSSESTSNEIDGEEKQVLFEKLFNFCNNNIKTNKKLEQYFGFLLLSELIEKCPLIQEEKNIDLIFKEFDNYFNNRLFECKLDLLNCTITLILTVNVKFSSHAKVCLYRVLDFLTDGDLEEKKLAINIVYILVIYCTENIMPLKDEIISLINEIKKKKDVDPNIKEVYLQTLKFIEENDKKYRKKKGENNNDDKNNNVNSINDDSPIKYEEKKMDISEDSRSQPSHFSSIGMERNESNSTNCKKSNSHISKSKSKNSFNNNSLKSNSKLGDRKNQYNSNNTNGIIMGNNNNKRFNKSTEQRGYTNKGEKVKNIRKIEKKIVKHETNSNFRDGVKRDKLFLKDYDQQSNERKMKQSQLSLNVKPSNMNSNYRKNIIKMPNLKNQTNNRNKTKKSGISKNKNNINNNINSSINNNTNNNNINNNNMNNEDDKFNKIMEQLNIIQLSQNNLIEVVNNLKDKVEMNYLNLDKRIKKLENCRCSKEENVIDDEKRFELIMDKYKSGQYDDAINESFDNDKYFYKLLPLIGSENITEINFSIIEKKIEKLNLDLPKLCKEEGQNNNINSILSFFNQLIRSKIDIKLINQVNIKDTLQTVKTDFNTKLSQNDNTIIDIILKSLKV